MRNIVIIFLFVTARLFGQSHQADILKFVDDNLGNKIGSGKCYELVQGAIRMYLPSYEMGYKEIDKKFYGKKIKLSKVQPGDILFLSGGTKKKVDHVCIVYKVDGDDIWVAEQNTKGDIKKSVVEINFLNFDSHNDFYGKICYSFYRPK